MLQHNKANTAYSTGEMHDAATAAEGEDAYFWPKVFFYDVCDSSQNGKVTEELQQGYLLGPICTSTWTYLYYVRVIIVKVGHICTACA